MSQRAHGSFWRICKVFFTLLQQPNTWTVRKDLRSLSIKSIPISAGAHENLTGPEDYDLQARLEKAGYKIGYTGSRILYHEENLSLKGYLQKRAYYARSFKRYALKHPERAKQQLGLVRVTVYVGAMLENPLLGLGLVVLKGLEYLTAKAVILSLRR